MKKLGLSISFPSEYTITEKDQNPVDGMRTDRVTATSKGGEIFRLEKISPIDSGEARHFIREQVVQIESIYEPRVAPYFAVLTQEVVCPKKFRPNPQELKKAGGALVWLLRFYSNEGLTYGACTEDLAAFRTTVGLLYCPGSKSYFKLESFIPTAKFKKADGDAIESVQCSR